MRILILTALVALSPLSLGASALLFALGLLCFPSRSVESRRSTAVMDYSLGTFTRSSEGAFADPRTTNPWDFAASGAGAWLSSNVPRIFSDFAVLIEGARTNLVTDSRDLSAASWNTTGATNTVTTGYADGPDGASGTADRIVCDATGYRGRNTGGDQGVDLAGSMYGKQGPGYANGPNPFVGNGSGTTGGTTATLDVAWKRIVWTHSSAVVSNDYFYPSTGPAQTGVGGLAAGARDSVIDLCQAEVGKFGSSPIRTSGGTATRATEKLVMANANVAASFFGTGFSVVVRPIFTQAQAPTDAYVYWIDANNYLVLRGTTLRLRANSTNFDIGSLVYAAHATLTIAVTWGGNMVLTGGGGGSVALTQSWSGVSSSDVHVGSDSTPANHFFGVIGRPT